MRNKSEKPIAGSPVVFAIDGTACIPQHFLQYQHTYNSLKEIIEDVKYSSRYPVFAGYDNGQLYIQIGIIGHDNYSPQNNHKIVYGRKWRVEQNLPTAEIVQTIFLALKKAREHEARELLTLQSRHLTKNSTPFNNHHDIDFIVRNQALLSTGRKITNSYNIKKMTKKCLDRLAFNGQKLVCNKIYRISDTENLYCIKLKGKRFIQNDFAINEIKFSLNGFCDNEFMHSIMDEIIKSSDRDVDEHFLYKGYARFSRKNDISAIGEMSIRLRNNKLLTKDFKRRLSYVNYRTDLSRIPNCNIA